MIRHHLWRCVFVYLYLYPFHMVTLNRMRLVTRISHDWHWNTRERREVCFTLHAEDEKGLVPQIEEAIKDCLLCIAMVDIFICGKLSWVSIEEPHSKRHAVHPRHCLAWLYRVNHWMYVPSCVHGKRLWTPIGEPYTMACLHSPSTRPHPTKRNIERDEMALPVDPVIFPLQPGYCPLARTPTRYRVMSCADSCAVCGFSCFILGGQSHWVGF